MLCYIVHVAQPGELGDNSGRVWKLNKALYGLMQEACEWHKVLVTWLHDIDFVRSHSDPALFIRKYGKCFICYTQAPGTHAWCSGMGVLVAWVRQCMALGLIPLRCVSGDLLVAVFACD